MLDRLERKGLITRISDEADRRQVRLLLTAQGKSMSSMLPTMEVAAMNEFAAGVTSEELMRLESLLAKMISANSPLIG